MKRKKGISKVRVVSLRVSDEELEELRAIMESTRLSVSDLMRRAIRQLTPSA